LGESQMEKQAGSAEVAHSEIVSAGSQAESQTEEGFP
jgi:hypothetical protein